MYLCKGYTLFGGYLLVFTIYLNLVYSWRSYDIDISGYRFEVADPTTFKSCYFSLGRSGNRTNLNGAMTFAHNITELSVELSVKIVRPWGDPMSLIDSTLDICEALEKKVGNLLRIIMEQFKKSSSYFPDKCPIMADRVIEVENFYIDPDMFPPYVPDMQFISYFHLLIKEKYIFKGFLNGSVFSKRSLV